MKKLILFLLLSSLALAQSSVVLTKTDATTWYNAPADTQLPAALDGSGYLKIHEQGTASVNVANTVTVSVSGTPTVEAVQSGTWTVVLTSNDPCQGNVKSYGTISQTADTTIITGVVGKTTYICSFNVVVSDAENISVLEGTNAGCSTGIGQVGGLSGGATAATGWNFAANGGIAIGNGNGTVGKQGTPGDNVCVVQSGSGRVSGGFSYVQI